MQKIDFSFADLHSNQFFFSAWGMTAIVNTVVVIVLQERVQMEPHRYTDTHIRPMLEERLESIISGAALMAESSCTRDDRRERIVAECNAVRQALQDLLTEYMDNVISIHFSLFSCTVFVSVFY